MAPSELKRYGHSRFMHQFSKNLNWLASTASDEEVVKSVKKLLFDDSFQKNVPVGHFSARES